MQPPQTASVKHGKDNFLFPAWVLHCCYCVIVNSNCSYISSTALQTGKNELFFFFLENEKIRWHLFGIYYYLRNNFF